MEHRGAYLYFDISAKIVPAQINKCAARESLCWPAFSGYIAEGILQRADFPASDLSRGTCSVRMQFNKIPKHCRGCVAESDGFLSPRPFVDNDDSRCGAAAATDTHKHTV